MREKSMISNGILTHNYYTWTQVSFGIEIYQNINVTG